MGFFLTVYFSAQLSNPDNLTPVFCGEEIYPWYWKMFWLFPSLISQLQATQNTSPTVLGSFTNVHVSPKRGALRLLNPTNLKDSLMFKFKAL